MSKQREDLHNLHMGDPPQSRRIDQTYKPEAADPKAIRISAGELTFAYLFASEQEARDAFGRCVVILSYGADSLRESDPRHSPPAGPA